MPPLSASHWVLSDRTHVEEVLMANHLTPDELSDALGISRKTLIKLCTQEGVPVFHGRIDKTLFVQTMTAAGHRLPDGLQEFDRAVLAPG
jgi:hypothetical protein